MRNYNEYKMVVPIYRRAVDRMEKMPTFLIAGKYLMSSNSGIKDILLPFNNIIAAEARMKVNI